MSWNHLSFACYNTCIWTNYKVLCYSYFSPYFIAWSIMNDTSFLTTHILFQLNFCWIILKSFWLQLIVKFTSIVKIHLNQFHVLKWLSFIFKINIYIQFQLCGQTRVWELISLSNLVMQITILSMQKQEKKLTMFDFQKDKIKWTLFQNVLMSVYVTF